MYIKNTILFGYVNVGHVVIVTDLTTVVNTIFTSVKIHDTHKTYV